MSTAAPNARALTRRLVARAAAGGEPSHGTGLAELTASESACAALSRSLGTNGFYALLTRSLAQAEGAHAILKEIRVGRNSEPVLGGVADIVQTHGAPAVAAALEAMLDTMFELLGRLIGEDMVPRLVERNAYVGTHDEGGVI